MRNVLPRCAALAVVCAASLTGAHAQVDEPEPWKEAEVTAPANWRSDRGVEFQIENQGALRFAIDPQTLAVGPDGVVRYVFIARSSSGALNVLYEGVRCQTAEVKVYARWDPDAKEWRSRDNEKWLPLEYRGATRRAMHMARGGLCDGKAPARSTSLMLDSLRNGRADQLR